MTRRFIERHRSMSHNEIFVQERDTDVLQNTIEMFEIVTHEVFVECF